MLILIKRLLWKYKKILIVLKNHSHHLIFIISIISLASLVAWWSIFIHNSIQQNRLYRYGKLETDLILLSSKLGKNEVQKPPIGALIEDTRFEVTACRFAKSQFSRRLEPLWPELCLNVRSGALEEIERKTRSLNVMLVGEASVLIIVIFISIVFLYHFIRLERRTAKEIEAFWERSAHEIKSPITGLKAFLENLRTGAFDSEKFRKYVDSALKQVEKQEHLAENILSGYQLKRSEKRMKRVDLRLCNFLEDYFKENPLRFAQAKVIFDFDRDSQIVARADPYDLKTILDNITDNAIKYCAPSLVLHVDCIGSKEKAIIVIKDNGPGFQPHSAKIIFKAYKHFDEELPIKRKGTGLGLYISRQLARNMGGDLEACSTGEGKGAEFRVILRRVK